MRTHTIGPRQQRFINEALALIERQGPATAATVAAALSTGPATTRTWLHHCYELGWLSRRRIGRRFVYHFEPVK